MYTAELSHLVAQHDLKFHQYAADCQIYVSTLVNAVHSAIDRFSCCLEDVEAWTTASRLNASKTQVMWLVNCSRRHIGTRPRRCNWQPVDNGNGWLRRVCLSLSLLSSATDQTHSTVANARWIYCNSLLQCREWPTVCSSVYSRCRTRRTRTGRCEHITPVLRELHWLPVRRRVDFKLATFMYKTLHGRLPRYLWGDCQLISDASRRLRSSDTFSF